MKPDELLRAADRDLDYTERLLSVAKAAHRLSVCRATVRRWIKAGRLPAMKYPGGFKIRPADIENIQRTFVDTGSHPAE